jgi:hypothetical protein
MMLIGDEPQSYPSYRDIALGRGRERRIFAAIDGPNFTNHRRTVS